MKDVHILTESKVTPLHVFIQGQKGEPGDVPAVSMTLLYQVNKQSPY